MAGAAGNRIAFGFKAESTPGTEATGTYAYIPVDPDQVNYDYDPARVPLDMAVGSQFSTIEAVEYEAKGIGSMQTNLFPTLTAGLLGIWGIGSGNLVAAQYHTVEINKVNGKTRYAGCLPKGFTITASSKTPVKFKGDSDFISLPNATGSPSAYTYPSFEKPYVFSSTKPATLPGSSNVTRLTDLMVQGLYNSFGFYGNHGNNLPVEMIPTNIQIKFSFTKLFTDNVEYNLFAANCMVPANLVFAWQNNCGGSLSATATITIPNAVYDKVGEKYPMNGAIVQMFSGFAVLQSLAGFQLAFA